MFLADAARLRDRASRALTAENRDGAPGGGGRATDGTGAKASRELGVGWKVSPSVKIAPGSTFLLGDIAGPGCIRHLWMTPTGPWRMLLLRIWWDDAAEPSVAVPLGDFFAMPWQEYAPLSSLAVCVNPGSGFNCFWPMPFRRRCRIAVENLHDAEITLYYQVDYDLGPVEADDAYFHAEFRRSNPLPERTDHVIAANIEGRGHYVGTALAWGVYNNGWWGEGEVKAFIDDDGAFPTICGTGTEDYFLGAYNFEHPKEKRYVEFSTPHSGLHQVIRPDGLYRAQQRFAMYRWHLADPIRFRSRLRLTVQALGWRSGGRYLPLRDDIASTAFYYVDRPQAAPALPEKNALEVV